MPQSFFFNLVISGDANYIYFFTFLTSLFSDSFHNIWFTSRLVISCMSASVPIINKLTGEYLIIAMFVTQHYRLRFWISLTALTFTCFLRLTNIELLLIVHFCVVVYLYVE